MRLLKKILPIALLLVCFLPVGAQQLTGFVFDGETGDSIPFASVLYKGHHVAVVSDTQGKFTIARHQGWNLTFSAVGYKAETIMVDETTETPLFIYLNLLSYFLFVKFTIIFFHVFYMNFNSRFC